MKTIIAFSCAMLFFVCVSMGQEMTITPAFQSIQITNPIAQGKIKTGELIAGLTIKNTTNKSLDLLIGTNKYNLIAVDENDQEHYAKSVSIGSKKETFLSGIPVKLAPNDSVYFKVLSLTFPRTSIYIKKLMINTTLSSEGIIVGDSIITIRNIKIDWK